MVDFGSKLKVMRVNKHLSQEQLAKRIGITKSMVSAYETSMRMPSYEVLIKVAVQQTDPIKKAQFAKILAANERKIRK